MWAYRLNKAPDNLRLTWRISTVRKRVLDTQLVAGTDHVFAFDNDLKLARQMARALGWDTTLACEEQCFSLPGPDSMLYGFLITQGTGSQRYVVSPVPLKFLEEHVDWDAHTSVEEVRKTQAALSGTVVEAKPPLRIGDWRRSAKGNMWTTINGANCTVFPTDGGYKAVVMNPAVANMKVYSRSFQTELEVANYVIQPDNFYNLVRGWCGTESSNAVDSPFADIDWGSDDDPDVPF